MSMNESFQVSIPDEYLAEIGRVSVQWSFLESMFDLCLMNLAGMQLHDSRAMAIFVHMTFPLKLDVFGTIVSELLPNYPRLDSYKEVLSQIREAQTARNVFVHSKWGMSEDGKSVEIANLSARGKLKTSVRTVRLDELRQTAELIGKASVNLYKLVIHSSS
jgi:hypothetical protein